MKFLKQIVFTSILILASFFLVSSKQDPDMWWHIKLGEEYVEYGNLQNNATLTCVDKTWINYSLNSDIIFYHIYKSTGFTGLYVFVYLILMLGIFITYKVFRRYLGRDPGFVIKLLFLLASVVFLNLFFSVRPHIFSYLYITIILYFFSRKTDLYFSVKEIFILSGISLIFANLHSGFFMGYVLIALLLLSNIVTSFIEYYKNPLKKNLRIFLNLLRNYIFLGLILLLVSLINFWGFGLWQEIVIQLVSKQTQSLSEWRSIDLKNIFYFGYFLMCVSIIYFRKLLGENQKLLFILIPFTLLSFQSIRAILNNVPILTIVFFLLFTILYERFSEELRFLYNNKLFQRVNFIYFFVILLVISFSSLVKISNDLNNLREFESAEVKNEYPKKALQYIQSDLSEKRFFNTYVWGGYLLFKEPNIKWFVDGRMAAWQCEGNYLNEEILADYLEVENLEPNWLKVLEHWNINAVLIKDRSRLANALSELPSWQLAYQDSLAVIFVKKI